MRSKSHRLLGEYLVQHYLNNIPEPQIRAFIIGCTQPDLNPGTYLKGSLRFQWLRGHNYPNSRSAMEKFCHRLESKKNLSIIDYYTLGKLIHYTADAFTFAHNPCFPKDLRYHRQYEAQLQTHFLSFLKSWPPNERIFSSSIMESISCFHREYSMNSPHIQNDIIHCHMACCSIFNILFSKCGDIE